MYTRNGQCLGGKLHPYTQHDSLLILKKVVSPYCFNVTYDSFQD